MKNNSCKNNDCDYGDDDSTMIHGAFTSAKPFKDFNLMYFYYNPEGRFHYLYSADEAPCPERHS